MSGSNTNCLWFDVYYVVDAGLQNILPQPIIITEEKWNEQVINEVLEKDQSKEGSCLIASQSCLKSTNGDALMTKLPTIIAKKYTKL